MCPKSSFSDLISTFVVRVYLCMCIYRYIDMHTRVCMYVRVYLKPCSIASSIRYCMIWSVFTNFSYFDHNIQIRKFYHILSYSLFFSIPIFRKLKFDFEGEEAEGVILPNGKRLKYTLSGHLQFWLSIILMFHAYPNIIETSPNSQIYAIRGFSSLKLTLLYDNYVQLIAVSVLGSTILSFYLYISSFIGKDKILANGGNTGNHIYDFFIGKIHTIFLSSHEFCFIVLFIWLYNDSLDDVFYYDLTNCIFYEVFSYFIF